MSPLHEFEASVTLFPWLKNDNRNLSKKSFSLH